MKYLLSHRTSYTYASSVDSAQHIAHLRARAVSRPEGQLDQHRDQSRAGAGGAACRPFRQQHRHLSHRQAAQALRHRGARRGRRAAFPIRRRPMQTPPWEEVRAVLERRRLSRAGRGERVRLRLAAGARVDGAQGLWRHVVHAGPADPRGGARAHVAHQGGFRVPPGRHRHQHAARRGVRRQGRRLPGFRPCRDRRAARPRPRRRATSRATSAPVHSKEEIALRGADASHAWVAVWCGAAAGWVHLDPTNDLVAKEDHVAVAWGRDFSDVSPLRGVILGGELAFLRRGGDAGADGLDVMLGASRPEIPSSTSCNRRRASRASSARRRPRR